MAVCRYYTDPKYNLTDADYLKFLYDNWPLLVRLAYTHWPPEGAEFMLDEWRAKPVYGFITLMDILTPMEQKMSRVFREISKDGSVGMVTGRRGSGKSYAATWLAHMIGKMYGKWLYHTGYVEIPGFFHVAEVSDAPRGSMTVHDEAQLDFDGRRAMSHGNVDETQAITTIRHTDKSVMYITQESRFVDTRFRSQADWNLFMRLGRGRQLAKAEHKALAEILPEVYHHMLPRHHGRALFAGESGVFTINIPGPKHPDGLGWWSDDISKSYSPIHNEKQARELAGLMHERELPDKMVVRRLKQRGWKVDEKWVKDIRNPSRRRATA